MFGQLGVWVVGCLGGWVVGCLGGWVLKHVYGHFGVKIATTFLAPL